MSLKTPAPLIHARPCPGVNSYVTSCTLPSSFCTQKEVARIKEWSIIIIIISSRLQMPQTTWNEQLRPDVGTWRRIKEGFKKWNLMYHLEPLEGIVKPPSLILYIFICLACLALAACFLALPFVCLFFHESLKTPSFLLFFSAAMDGEMDERKESISAQVRELLNDINALIFRLLLSV